MLAVKGISETALYVDDVRRSVEFYHRVFGFPILGRLRPTHGSEGGGVAGTLDHAEGCLRSTDGDILRDYPAE